MAFRRVETRSVFLSVLAPESIKIKNVWGDAIDQYQYDERFAAFYEGESIGVIRISYFNDPYEGRKRLLITDIFVQPEWRRQGVATLLYNHVKKIAEEFGYELEHTSLTDEGAAWRNSLPS